MKVEEYLGEEANYSFVLRDFYVENMILVNFDYKNKSLVRFGWMRGDFGKDNLFDL